jgi:hypothetical protein
MKSSTIYQGKRAYAEVDVDLYQKTGEIKIVDTPFLADNAVTKIRRGGFEITYLAYFCDLFDKLGGQKYKVFKYIIENKNSDNQLIITMRELAEKTKTSLETVRQTIKLLQEKDLITTRVGSIMISPMLAHKGDDRKEAYLMRKFEEFSPDEIEPSNN